MIFVINGPITVFLVLQIVPPRVNFVPHYFLQIT